MDTVSFIDYCIRNHPKTLWLKTTILLYLVAPLPVVLLLPGVSHVISHAVGAAAGLAWVSQALELLHVASLPTWCLSFQSLSPWPLSPVACPGLLTWELKASGRKQKLPDLLNVWVQKSQSILPFSIGQSSLGASQDSREGKYTPCLDERSSMYKEGRVGLWETIWGHLWKLAATIVHVKVKTCLLIRSYLP